MRTELGRVIAKLSKEVRKPSAWTENLRPLDTSTFPDSLRLRQITESQKATDLMLRIKLSNSLAEMGVTDSYRLITIGEVLSHLEDARVGGMLISMTFLTLGQVRSLTQRDVARLDGFTGQDQETKRAVAAKLFDLKK